MGDAYNNACAFNKAFKLGTLFDDEKLSDMSPCKSCKIHIRLMQMCDASSVARYGDDPDEEKRLSKNCHNCLKSSEYISRCLSKLVEYEKIEISTKELRKIINM